MYQLRNLIGRTNISGDPTHKFNEADDLFKLLVTCHMLAAALKHLQMKTLSDVPSMCGIEDPESLWMETAEKRKSVLQNVCREIVEGFASFEFNKLPKQSDDKVLQFH